MPPIDSDDESDSESAPLNPSAITTHSTNDAANLDPDSNGSDPEFNPLPLADHVSADDISAEFHEMNTPRKRDPMHILILYGISFIVSLGGLGVALAGYGIVRTAPFDERSKKWQRMAYEENFWEMQSIVVLLAINVLTTALNLRLALRGRQDVHELLWLFNTVYDFLIWAALIAFGVENMVFMLWDRRLCDGWSDDEMYKKCDVAMLKLLVVELVAVNLGVLAAVSHFILLIGRCCTCGSRNYRQRALYLQRRIRQEEEVLMLLVERRKRLEEETEGIEARRIAGREERPLPRIPADEEETDGVEARRTVGQEEHPLPRIPADEEETERVEARRTLRQEERPLPRIPGDEEEERRLRQEEEDLIDMEISNGQSPTAPMDPIPAVGAQVSS